MENGQETQKDFQKTRQGALRKYGPLVILAGILINANVSVVLGLMVCIVNNTLRKKG